MDWKAAVDGKEWRDWDKGLMERRLKCATTRRVGCVCLSALREVWYSCGFQPFGLLAFYTCSPRHS
jgi:hypothetical protein